MIFFFIFSLILGLFLYCDKKKFKLDVKWILITALLARFLVILIFPESKSEDLVSVVESGAISLGKNSIYPTLYFPFMPYLGILALKSKTFIDPLIFLKALFSFFDVLVVYLIFLISGNKSITLLYALNPVTILNAGIHGQFDTIPLFFLLLGIYLFQKKKEFSSVLSLSFAIFTKTWPFLFVPPLFRKSKKKFYYVFLCLFPLISVIIYLKTHNISFVKILTPIKDYRGLFGFWGISEIVNLLFPRLDGSIIQIFRRVFLIVFLIYSLIFSYKKILEGSIKQILFFFVFTVTFGVQWLTWLTPFIFFSKSKYIKIYIVISTFYLISAYFPNIYSVSIRLFPTLNNIRKILGLADWGVLILMFFAINKNIYPNFSKAH